MLQQLFQGILLTVVITSFPNSKNVEEFGYSIEMLPWETVNEIIPNKNFFTIMDVDTGKKFNVQRRAGSRHADVQPVTDNDTKIMKEIYNGKWDWKRKAIIVIANGRWIAASMHGMPHGAGALNNNFPGHFCVHFYGSTTHLTGKMDLSHKLMVYKAAGKLEEYINRGEPEDIVKALITGIKQQDADIMKNTSTKQMDWNKINDEIKNIKLTDINVVNELPFYHEFEIKLDWVSKDNHLESFAGKISVVRLSPMDPWKIDNEKFFRELLIADPK